MGVMDGEELFEVKLGLTSDGFVRLEVYQLIAGDEEFAERYDIPVKIIAEIYEVDPRKIDWLSKQVTKLDRTMVISREHDGVDLGKARTMRTKIHKIAESLLAPTA